MQYRHVRHSPTSSGRAPSNGVLVGVVGVICGTGEPLSFPPRRILALSLPGTAAPGCPIVPEHRSRITHAWPNIRVVRSGETGTGLPGVLFGVIAYYLVLPLRVMGLGPEFLHFCFCWQNHLLPQAAQ